MTPHRSRGRGTFIIDREWQGVRLWRASGTTDPDVYAALNRALQDLKRSHDVGLSTRLAIWGELAEGTRHPMVFLEQVRMVGLSGLRPGVDQQAVRKLLAAWIEARPATRRGRPLAPSTIESYRLHVEQHVLSRWPNATLDDLPEIARRIRDEASSGTAAVTRTAVMAIVRWRLGRRSALWRALSDTPLPATADHDREGLPIDEVRRITLELGRDGVYWWALCTTGMRIKREYLDCRGRARAITGARMACGCAIGAHAPVPWRVLRNPDRIEIPDSKTRAGRRIIPLVGPVERCRLSYSYLSKRLKALGVKAHIARYSFQHLLQEAGIPPARIDLYMGHQLKGIRVYGRHEVMHYLAQDTPKIQAVFGDEPTQLRAVR